MTDTGNGQNELLAKLRSRLVAAGMTEVKADEAIANTVEGVLRYIELTLNDRLVMQLSAGDILNDASGNFSGTGCGGPDDQPPPQESLGWESLSLHPGKPPVHWTFIAYCDDDPATVAAVDAAPSIVSLPEHDGGDP